jgi:uncharacterized membrane protein
MQFLSEDVTHLLAELHRLDGFVMEMAIVVVILATVVWLLTVALVLADCLRRRRTEAPDDGERYWLRIADLRNFYFENGYWYANE